MGQGFGYEKRVVQRVLVGHVGHGERADLPMRRSAGYDRNIDWWVWLRWTEGFVLQETPVENCECEDFAVPLC
jgi:hypothetical protein